MSKDFRINAATELKERTAALNTQLRFGRERQALMHAYELRTFLQLRGAKTEDEKRQLAWVEKVIVGLEKRKTSGIQRLVKTIIETAIRSMTPEDDSERTLLDQFGNTAGRPSHEEEEFPETVVSLEEGSQEEELIRVVQEGPQSEDGDWGWGAQETVSATASPPNASIPPPPQEPEKDHWGGTGGYTYDDKF